MPGGMKTNGLVGFLRPTTKSITHMGRYSVTVFWGTRQDLRSHLIPIAKKCISYIANLKDQNIRWEL